jgi:hypothetical protein
MRRAAGFSGEQRSICVLRFLAVPAIRINSGSEEASEEPKHSMIAQKQISITRLTFLKSAGCAQHSRQIFSLS